MTKNIILPAPQLSQLKSVNVDLNMTGRHYAFLATSEGQIPEEVVLSIVKDLMVEDANKLTLTELRYVFTLIKINSLENEYNVSVVCNYYDEKKKGPCKTVNVIPVSLSDSDLNKCPNDYKVPEIEFYYEKDKQKVYSVMPPTVDMEIGLIKLFTLERNKTIEEVMKDETEKFNYSICVSLLHLIDKDGKRLIQNLSDIDSLLKYLDLNPYMKIKQLLQYQEEVSSFGIQNKIYECNCKECGGKLRYRIPLLHGLVS